MSELEPGPGDPRIHIEVATIKPELLTRGTWIFTAPDQVVPVLVESVMLMTDKHGRLVRVTDTKASVYIFRPDNGDTVDIVA